MKIETNEIIDTLIDNENHTDIALELDARLEAGWDIDHVENMIDNLDK